MTMTYDTERFDVVVIGAGIGGLTCAYELAKAGLKVLVADGQNESGGVIQTRHVDGFLLELGPNSFSTSRPEANRVLEELGLDSRLQSRVMKEHVRYVWRNGKLCPVPTSLGQFLGSDLLTTGEKARAAIGALRWFPPPYDDVEAGLYFRPRLGDGVVEAMVRPAVAGIYAADVDHISLESTFPRIFESARLHGRLIGVLKGLAKGKDPASHPRSLATFDEGLQTLPLALADAIVHSGGEVALGEQVHLQQTCTQYTEERWTIKFSGGRRVIAGQVIIAACAGAAGELLRSVAEDVSEAFASIEYAPLAVVHVGGMENQFLEQRDGFGFLNTRDSALRALGMVWNDRLFDGRAPDGHRLLTCFFGGELDPEAVALSDGEMERQVRTDLKRAMGFHGDFSLFRVTRWKSAIPLFRVGHAQRIRSAAEKLPIGIRLLGSYTGDPSLPGRMKAGLDLAHQIAIEEAFVAV